MPKQSPEPPFAKTEQPPAEARDTQPAANTQPGFFDSLFNGGSALTGAADARRGSRLSMREADMESAPLYGRVRDTATAIKIINDNPGLSAKYAEALEMAANGNKERAKKLLRELEQSTPERSPELEQFITSQIDRLKADKPLQNFLNNNAPLPIDQPTAEPIAEADDASVLEPQDLDPINPLSRKLELAEEFRQIGDIVGARDLLEEVVAKNAEGVYGKLARARLEELDPNANAPVLVGDPSDQPAAPANLETPETHEDRALNIRLKNLKLSESRYHRHVDDPNSSIPLLLFSLPIYIANTKSFLDAARAANKTVLQGNGEDPIATHTLLMPILERQLELLRMAREAKSITEIENARAEITKANNNNLFTHPRDKSLREKMLGTLENKRNTLEMAPRARAAPDLPAARDDDPLDGWLDEPEPAPTTDPEMQRKMEALEAANNAFKKFKTTTEKADREFRDLKQARGADLGDITRRANPDIINDGLTALSAVLAARPLLSDTDPEAAEIDRKYGTIKHELTYMITLIRLEHQDLLGDYRQKTKDEKKEALVAMIAKLQEGIRIQNIISGPVNPGDGPDEKLVWLSQSLVFAEKELEKLNKKGLGRRGALAAWGLIRNEGDKYKKVISKLTTMRDPNLEKESLISRAKKAKDRLKELGFKGSVNAGLDAYNELPITLRVGITLSLAYVTFGGSALAATPIQTGASARKHEQKLVAEYMQNNHVTDVSQIPENDRKKIETDAALRGLLFGAITGVSSVAVGALRAFGGNDLGVGKLFDFIKDNAPVKIPELALPKITNLETAREARRILVEHADKIDEAIKKTDLAGDTKAADSLRKQYLELINKDNEINQKIRDYTNSAPATRQAASAAPVTAPTAASQAAPSPYTPSSAPGGAASSPASTGQAPATPAPAPVAAPVAPSAVSAPTLPTNFPISSGDNLETLMKSKLDILSDLTPKRQENVIYNFLESSVGKEWMKANGITNMNRIFTGNTINLESLSNAISHMRIDGEAIIEKAKNNANLN